MLEWYRRFGPDERRTFWACFGGWALDALDVQIYTFVIPALIAVWGTSPRAQAGLLATGALVISAFGGWIAGMLADRVGRVRTAEHHRRLVRRLHLPLRLHPEFRAVAGHARAAGLRLRRRVGGGLGADGRGGSRAPSRQGGRHGAERLGGGLGRRRDPCHDRASSSCRRRSAWRALFFVGILPAFLVLLRPQQGRAPSPRSSQAAAEAVAPRGLFAIFAPDLLADHPARRRCSRPARRAATTPSPPGCRPSSATERHLVGARQPAAISAVIIVGSWCGYVVGA